MMHPSLYISTIYYLRLVCLLNNIYGVLSSFRQDCLHLGRGARAGAAGGAAVRGVGRARDVRGAALHPRVPPLPRRRVRGGGRHGGGGEGGAVGAAVGGDL